MNKSAQFFLMTTTVLVSALCAGTWRAGADTLDQTDLVSDVSGLADITDSALQNPWGVAHSGTSPFWVSNQVTSTATLYAVTGSLNTTGSLNVTQNPLTVAIPMTASGPQGPTGQVANVNADGTQAASFAVNGAPAHFIFANLNGTISAWNGTGTTATIQAATPGATYTGLAINQAVAINQGSPQPLLYAAGAGGINVFDGSFKPVTNLPAGAFATPTAIAQAGLVPFNVQNINGNVYVTYAPAGRTAQQTATPGMGAVAIFNATGTLQQTILGGPNAPLAAPWGVTLAPANFGQFSNDLLIGNFSYMASEINAFDPTTGKFEGTISVDPGKNQTPGGLWFLGFGTGGSNGLPDTLFFTDGIDGETHGLFGAISDVTGVSTPIPAALPGMVSVLIGGGLLAWWRKRRQQIA